MEENASFSPTWLVMIRPERYQNGATPKWLLFWVTFNSCATEVPTFIYPGNMGHTKTTGAQIHVSQGQTLIVRRHVEYNVTPD